MIWIRRYGSELDGIAVTRVLLRGNPAHEIVKTARDHNVDLIAMSTRGEGVFYRFLLGSVTAKVLHEIQCPVWIWRLTWKILRRASFRFAASCVRWN